MFSVLTFPQNHSAALPSSFSRFFLPFFFSPFGPLSSSFLLQVTLADKYEYVMHGRVYRCEHQKDTKVQVYASFGGLLMRLTGDQRHVANIEVDSRVFCLIRQNA